MQECGQAGDFKAGSFALLVSYGLAKCAFLVVPIGFQGGVSFVNKDKSGARLSDSPVPEKKSAIHGIKAQLRGHNPADVADALLRRREAGLRRADSHIQGPRNLIPQGIVRLVV